MEEVLVFPSTYYMLRSEELLKRKGSVLRLVPAPPQAGGLCVTVALAIAFGKGARAGHVNKIQRLFGRGIGIHAHDEGDDIHEGETR